jgi:hypothetical protein
LGPERIVCADWGKEPKKRAAYEALVRERVVRRVTADVRDVKRLLHYASSTSRSTLVAFDAPIGVPATFIEAVRRVAPCSDVRGFTDWIQVTSFGDCADAQSWSVQAPFFRVPPRKGGLRGFEDAALRLGVDLRRKIEQETGGKSVFVTAGIPGSVGSAARDIWRGVVQARAERIPFTLWPFEASELRWRNGPVVAEIYPRAAYATALVDEAPRARMSLAKTNGDTRARALVCLTRSKWSAASAIKFEDLDRASTNEDDFDALMTAAALLRCVVEGLPLWASPIHLPLIEGAILGTGSVALSLPEKTF